MIVPGSRETVHMDRYTFNELRSAANDSVSYENTKRTGYPYNTPNTSRSRTARDTLFEAVITDAMRETKYMRGIAGPIVDKVIDDALKNRFYINKPSTPEEPDREKTNKFLTVYQDKVKDELDKALKLARLHGYSLLLLGIRDGRQLNEPAGGRAGTPIEYIQTIPKTWVEKIVYETDNWGNKLFPAKIKSYKLRQDKFEKGTSLHTSRVILVENHGLNLGDEIGVSAIDRPFNIISVVDHMIWSTGQTMWRYSGGLLSILMPPDSNPDDQQTVLDMVGDVNAKTVLTFPDGYKPDILGMASAALNPGPYFDKMMEQLAGATEYPKTILYGLSTGAVTGSQLDRSTYYSKVVVKQNWITGILTAILERFLPDEKGWTIVWNSPYEQTDKEKLEDLKLQAQTDERKILSFTRTPDELRERDGLPKLTADQIALLQLVQKSSPVEKINPPEKNPNTKFPQGDA